MPSAKGWHFAFPSGNPQLLTDPGVSPVTHREEEPSAVPQLSPAQLFCIWLTQEGHCCTPPRVSEWCCDM